MCSSDLFDDRVTGSVRTYAPYARIIHADIDPAEIGKNVAVEVPIVGDAKRVLQALTGLVEAVEPETRAEHPSLDDVIAGVPGFRPTTEGHPKQLRLAAREIAAAKRPLILAGHGVLIAEAWDALKTFADKTQIPVAWTLLGIGAIDEEDPLAYGYMGMHGWKHVNRAIQSADLLIALGMRFDDRVTGNVRTYAPYARIIHADIDPAEIGRASCRERV